MQKISYVLFLVVLNYCTSNQISWLDFPPQQMGHSHQMVYYPFQSSIPREKLSRPSCRNCFYHRTEGTQMVVEPCENPDCIPIVKHRDLAKFDQPTTPYDFSQCGMTSFRSLFIKKALKLKISTSIENTLRPNEYPWLVRLESRSSFYSTTVALCGGTLIHPQWIITAAHCLFDNEKHRLYPTDGVDLHIGHYHRSNTSENAYVVQPISYLIHPKFRITQKSPAPVHDLAMLKLPRPVRLSSSINTACLPQSTDQLKDGKLAYTAGWGYATAGAAPVDEPRKAKIRISPHSCREFPINKHLHICGRNARGNNICSGDSGTGLMIRAGLKDENNQTRWKWHVFGVASFGFDECSPSVNHDNAFASVSADIDWIQEVMRKY